MIELHSQICFWEKVIHVCTIFICFLSQRFLESVGCYVNFYTFSMFFMFAFMDLDQHKLYTVLQSLQGCVFLQ